MSAQKVSSPPRIVWSWLFLILFVIIAGYVGVSVYGELRLERVANPPHAETNEAVKYKGITFENYRAMELYQLDEDRAKFHPWTEPMDQWLALLILASCTGFLGGLFRFLVDLSVPGLRPSFTRCLMGLGIGICLMAVAWASETLILEGEPHFRFEMLAVVCFLAGIFVQEAWNYVSKSARKIFEQPDDGQPEKGKPSHHA